MMFFSAGRKSYLFVVGKVNVAKLANYADIDLFVMVACPENSMLDCKEYYKPIVTPFELQLALDPKREWTGEYKIDFRDVLPQLMEATENSWTTSEEEDAPSFSLITGKYQHRQKMLDIPKTTIDENKPSEDSTALRVRNTQTHMTLQYESPAALRLNARVYRGLEIKAGENVPTAAVLGHRGIASDYIHVEK